MRRASAAAGLPGAMPQRSMPTSISTRPPSVTPNSCATREAASTCSAAVEAQRDRGILCQRREAAQLALADDLVAHQHVLHAAAHQRLGLADLLHALPDRALRDLPERNGCALMRLGVRSHADAGRPRELRHLGDVAVERIEVDDERRRFDVVDGSTDLGGRRVHGAIDGLEDGVVRR